MATKTNSFSTDFKYSDDIYSLVIDSLATDATTYIPSHPQELGAYLCFVLIIYRRLDTGIAKTRSRSRSRSFSLKPGAGVGISNQECICMNSSN